MAEVTIENMPNADEYNDASKEVLTFILTSDGGGDVINQIKTMMDYTEGLHLALRKAVGMNKS